MMDVIGNLREYIEASTLPKFQQRVINSMITEIRNEFTLYQDQIHRRNMQIKELKNKLSAQSGLSFTQDERYMILDCLAEWEKENQKIIRQEEYKIKTNTANDKIIQNALAEINCQQEQMTLIEQIQQKFINR